MAQGYLELETNWLQSLLSGARQLEEQRTNALEHAAQCVEAERVAVRNALDATWLQEMQREYARQAEEATAQLSEIEVTIRGEISRIDRWTGHSLALQLQFARFLDEQGRDGTAVARRAVMLNPSSPRESLELSGYLAEKGQYQEAADAAQGGWQRFGDRVLRAQWAELLEKAGQYDELIDLLQTDLRARPDDLALMERLAALLLAAGHAPQACEVMGQALGHPAGGSRLLANFMMALVPAGRMDLALRLAAWYVSSVNNKMTVRRELAETLRNGGYLRTALDFLDAQVEGAPGDTELISYRTAFLVNSVRSDRSGTRQDALALLRSRRDVGVEGQLVELFGSTRGDELRLSMLAALSKIQGPDALPFLTEALGNDSRRVRIAAARAIAEQLGEPLPPGASDGLNGETPAIESPPRDIPPAARAAGRKVLVDRLAIEADDSVRQAIAGALHRVDPGPRRPWEQAIGSRPWAGEEPGVGPLVDPATRRRRVGWGLLLGGLLAVLLLMVLPIHPSPRAMVLGYGQEAYGLIGTRVARSRTTPTAPPAPTATPTRATSNVDNLSGQVKDVLGSDGVRVQLPGQLAPVRYIGVEMPAEGGPGVRAATDANRSLVSSRPVYLEKGEIPTDTNGRWWRYVWLPEGQMANEKLLELGFGAPAPDPVDTKYQQRLADAATRAWQQKAGFWSGKPDAFAMAAVRSAEANVREAPGTEQKVKLQLKQGAVLVVVGRNVAGDWVEVRIPGNTTGWMSKQVIDLTVPVPSLPLRR